MPIPRVIDLSHHNTVPQDFLATKAAGVVGIIHKITEGESHVDSKCQARHYLAAQAGLAFGLYHFLRPGNMERQAAFMLDTAQALDVIDSETLVCADHEDEGVSGEELKAFLDALEDMTQRSPVIYSGHVLKEQLAGSGYRPTRRLWLAQYSATPTLPEGVDSYWLWQYTDQGTIAGINPPTDLNHFDGDAAAFLASWSGAYDPAPPAQDVPTLTISSNKPVKIHVGPNIEIV